MHSFIHWQSRAHKMVFDYLDAGADDEISLRRGKDAYSELEMHFHVLAGLSPPLDLSTKVFGKDVKLPFFGCPTAGNRMFHTEGEVSFHCKQKINIVINK